MAEQTPQEKQGRIQHVLAVFTLSRGVALVVAILVGILIRNLNRPAIWQMPALNEEGVAEYAIVGVREDLDELVIAKSFYLPGAQVPAIPAPPLRGTPAGLPAARRPRVPAPKVALPTERVEFTVLSLSTGNVKQTFTLKENVPPIQVTITPSVLICCGTETNYLTTIDRATKAIGKDVKYPDDLFTTVSPDGNYIVRSFGKLYYRDVNEPKTRWHEISGYGCQIFSWSPDGRFLVYRMGQGDERFGVFDFATKENVEHGVPHEDLVVPQENRIYWQTTGRAIVSHKVDVLKPAPNGMTMMYRADSSDGRVLHFLIDLSATPVEIRPLTSAESAQIRLPDPNEERYEHLFANGVRIVGTTRPLSPIQQTISDWLARYKLHWPSESIIASTQQLEKYESASNQPGYVRSAMSKVPLANALAPDPLAFLSPELRPYRFTRVTRGAEHTPFCGTPTVCPTVFVQPNYLGVINKRTLSVYLLQPMMPTLLFQALVTMGTFAFLEVMRISVRWLWPRQHHHVRH